MFFLDSCLLQNEDRHELPEELTHGVHALLPRLHVVHFVSHRQEHRLHPSGVRCDVQFRITLRYVRHTDEVRSGLHDVQRLFEPLEARHTAKLEVFLFCQQVVRCQPVSVL